MDLQNDVTQSGKYHNGCCIDDNYWKSESRGSRSTKTTFGLSGPVMSSREVRSVSLSSNTEAHSGEGIVNNVGSVSHQSPEMRYASANFLQNDTKVRGISPVKREMSMSGSHVLSSERKTERVIEDESVDNEEGEDDELPSVIGESEEDCV